MKTKKVIIMGAAGRDFHNFNVFFRDRPEFEVVAFTAAQLPGIANRKYPPELAGKLYPEGIPIYDEKFLPELIERYKVDIVVLAYSDLSHDYVMQRAERVLACGADFWLLGPKSTMLKSRRPVISVCAVRTGCGKSEVSRYIGYLLKRAKKKYVVVRHPMPYGVLKNQIWERIEDYQDLVRYKCTIEEREEYEPHIERGEVVYAGVDYGEILRRAEKEAEIIIWDGGNNDLPFYKPDLHIVLVDPLRPGHEVSYYPGEANLMMADIVVVNKESSAGKGDISQVKENVRRVNPRAKIVDGDSVISVKEPHVIEGKKVVVVEDGPTLTHGGMSFGAGTIAAKKHNAELVDPRKFAVGSIREVYRKFKQLGPVLPAMGYSPEQLRELEETINRTPADAVVIGTPIRLNRLLNLNKPAVRVTYKFKDTKGELKRAVMEWLEKI